LQRAIEETAKTRQPLALPAGVYRAGNLKLPSGAQIMGVRGATRLVFSDGPSLISAEGADHVTLSGLVLDGGKRPLPDGRGLVHIERADALRLIDCELTNAGSVGIMLQAASGDVSGNTITASGDAAIFSKDAAALTISRNHIDGAGNNGILVWQQEKRDDGTLVADNRIENIANRSGGSGQYGNAINVFRAGNVRVRGNQIRNCAFSGVRGNAASNIHIVDNTISNAGEVAIYSEFGFEGAVISTNSIDGAAIGVSVTNFNEGGRLAVVQGNLIRNLKRERPAGTDPGDAAGVGISVEADTAVTGNVVENAPAVGIMLGWGRYLRDVTATGNVVRNAEIGIAVSVAAGAGTALIADNVIAEVRRGAIVGMDRGTLLTGDMAKDGAGRYAQLSISGNRVR
jgi:uncharacterized secreted repeat protein (TIGR03808 family)